jgi:hypothetical protein
LARSPPAASIASLTGQAKAALRRWCSPWNTAATHPREHGGAERHGNHRSRDPRRLIRPGLLGDESRERKTIDERWRQTFATSRRAAPARVARGAGGCHCIPRLRGCKLHQDRSSAAVADSHRGAAVVMLMYFESHWAEQAGHARGASRHCDRFVAADCRKRK